MTLEYDTFVDNLESLKEGEEIELTVRDTQTYEAKMVRAVLYSERQKSPQGVTLWIRFNQGVLHPKPWVLEIKKEMGSPVENLV